MRIWKQKHHYSKKVKFKEDLKESVKTDITNQILKM